ncbi:hypothetical protein FAZ15_16520 [Sphingobacterium olei]|uniref:Signal transduction histidine kinase internal region domain-containing protein n=1 Tax=Sphingobacterium olei TaxID=2571155 RepID=A0A4U0NHG3_9SPHI|nr:hypothetical protein [Sphingobacterium olei]TJZ53636.1 hypothetical protein FAZ15_16520 [Sphingobacterium olei]
MSSFIDRIFGTKIEVDLANARFQGALSFERSQLEKCLLNEYLKKDLLVHSSSFIQFLQTNLTREEDQLIPLSEELACLNEYIELYKAIREDNFHIHYELPIEIAPLQIYPFMLFPIIQNAIQNGYNSMENYPIKIRVRITHAKVHMEVSNRVNHHIVNQGDNSFVEFYKQRLILHYPEGHELMINSNSNTFKATVTIHLNS